MDENDILDQIYAMQMCLIFLYKDFNFYNDMKLHIQSKKAF